MADHMQPFLLSEKAWWGWCPEEWWEWQGKQLMFIHFRCGDSFPCSVSWSQKFLIALWTLLGHFGLIKEIHNIDSEERICLGMNELVPLLKCHEFVHIRKSVCIIHNIFVPKSCKWIYLDWWKAGETEQFRCVLYLTSFFLGGVMPHSYVKKVQWEIVMQTPSRIHVIS